MIKIEYFVTIQRENDKLSGIFKKTRKIAETTENGKKKYKYVVLAEKNFCPTTVLMDLCEKAKNGLSQNDVKMFFGFYERYIPQIDTLQLLDYIEKSLNKKETMNIHKLEQVKVLAGVSCEYSIWKKGAGKDPEEYVPYAPYLDTDEDIFTQSGDFQFIYKCNEMLDMIYAIFHYFAIYEYKVSICRHCGKKFLTTSLKNTLCVDRNTPYIYSTHGVSKKYSLKDKNCKEAVRTIKDAFRQRKKHLMAYYDRDGYGRTDDGRKFDVGTWKYVEKIKDQPSVENLKAYEKYLYEDNLTKKEKTRKAD